MVAAPVLRWQHAADECVRSRQLTARLASRVRAWVASAAAACATHSLNNSQVCYRLQPRLSDWALTRRHARAHEETCSRPLEVACPVIVASRSMSRPALGFALGWSPARGRDRPDRTRARPCRFHHLPAPASAWSTIRGSSGALLRQICHAFAGGPGAAWRATLARARARALLADDGHARRINNLNINTMAQTVCRALPAALALALQQAPPRLLEYLFGADVPAEERRVSPVRRVRCKLI
jgi:hypothetical protein